MSPTRKAILLAISTGMIVSGAWILHEQFLVPTYHGNFVLAGPALISLGIALMWEDLVAPILKRAFSASNRQENQTGGTL